MLLAGDDMPNFDKYKRARLPMLLGWPRLDCTPEKLLTGIPDTGIALSLDLAAIRGELPTILRKADSEFLFSRFGSMPPRAR
eukprot:3935912-Rhodomonas_salina.1